MCVGPSAPGVTLRIAQALRWSSLLKRSFGSVPSRYSPEGNTWPLNQLPLDARDAVYVRLPLYRLLDLRELPLDACDGGVYLCSSDFCSPGPRSST